jgi:hypothetical protein
MTYDEMLQKIVNNEPFALNRWGDGELSCAFGYEGGNCDGHFYFDDLGKALMDILCKPQRYIMGLQPKAVNDMPVGLATHFGGHNIDHDWINSDIIHDASTEVGLEGLFAAIKGKAIIVGPAHLRPLAEQLNTPLITVPDRNCWKVYASIKEKCNNVNPDIFLFCCGMMANVLIDDLWYTKGHDTTLIDVGSALAPYAGKATRRYHKAILERNKNEKA